MYLRIPCSVPLILTRGLTTSSQFGVYHHVTGVDASSSASLAAYINTLTYKEHGPGATSKIVEGLYWYELAASRRFTHLSQN